ncbi:MAG: DNA topoisomerase (ATP-hydrolyzing) subunit A [Bullifex sp.]|nr:DNA topoisomerase (ATP-hydrolyzing) subunit A [Spirochaetales bacterium]MDY2816872.1 DNA topoisomerase (ATP-hydrolyzing) subunit A [Bullifex sp.]MDD7008452.1 DNA topoisomerase (ATP-hydrolyzing) subunit A [Spirochaetales bacterium]MDD7536189.1 DNA topoisomerase (ATP-hydrolyzing) subunit A [Spirochaetales bacterium]MDY3849553.1 DNA topoisomerase (ATP-hydrolyzing) subunit A [Bullifex sp.]
MDDELTKAEDINSRTIIADVSKEMKTSYLNYAMSVIVSRALPDVRDGLKPVHRRILYDMYEMGLKASGSYKKCARIVGDVLGKYHPHGDASVYDALVRLAQDFSLRYPVVTPQGNFGSIDGDPPAAMRYTESKMSRIGEEMLTDIGKNTVDFGPNYDDSLEEPTVLPAAFPFLLTNGTSGIAVGMATNMAPHNLTEVVDGICAFIDNPEISSLELMDYVKGPDFPSAGIICGKRGIMDAYTTGKGKIIIRSRYEIEENDKGHDRIIFSEIPYQVNKAELVKKIDDLRKDNAIPNIAQVRDESDRDGIRIVVDLKQGAVPNIVLNMLFSRTALQSNFNVYNLALKDGRPKVLTLRDMISSYVDHREQVIERRTRFDLQKAEERAHILLGLKIGLDNIDEVIEIIKASEDNNVASLELQKRFGLDGKQAAAIIDMKLGRLSHLETQKILDELAEIEAQIAYFKELLSDRNKILGVVKKEIQDIGQRYGDRRRTEIQERELENATDADFIKEEQVVVLISNKGFAKRLSAEEYKAQSRGGKGVRGAKLTDGDFVEHMFIASSHDIVMYVTNLGKAYYTYVYEIPEGAKNSKGANLKNFLQIENQEKVTSIICFEDFKDDEYLMMITKYGVTKKVELSAFVNAKKRGVKAIILDEGDSLVQSIFVNEGDDVMIVSKYGKGLRTGSDSIRTMGRSTRGVRAMKLLDDDEIIGLVRVEEGKRILMVTENGKGKQVRFEEFNAHGRATMGQKIYSVDDKASGLVNALAVNDENDVVFVTLNGQTIRVHVKDISIQGRSARGVKVASFKKKDDSIVAMAATDYQEESDEEIEIPEQAPAENEATAEPVSDDQNQ